MSGVLERAPDAVVSRSSERGARGVFGAASDPVGRRARFGHRVERPDVGRPGSFGGTRVVLFDVPYGVAALCGSFFGEGLRDAQRLARETLAAA